MTGAVLRAVVRAGGAADLRAIPTETVYGLAADAANGEGVAEFRGQAPAILIR